MNVATRLTQAAQHLESAATSLRAIVDAPDLPRLGRRQALGAIRSSLSESLSQARSGHELLGEGLTRDADIVAAVGAIVDDVEAMQPGLGKQVQSRNAASIVEHELRWHASSLRVRAGVAERSSEDARRLLTDRVRSIVDGPADEVTLDEFRELATIASLPREYGIDLGETLRRKYSWEQLAARTGRPADDVFMGGELERLRLDAARHRVVADPATSVESLTSEIREIAAGGDVLTTPQLRRIAVIAGLPEHLRPPLLDLEPIASLVRPQRVQSATATSWRGTDSVARRDIGAALRRAIDHEPYLRDPVTSSTSTTSELVDLVLTPDHVLADEDLVRIRTLMTLPPDIGPSLPARSQWGRHVEELGDPTRRPTRSNGASGLLDEVRTHLAATVDPDELGRRLGARVRAGADVDLRLVQRLADRGGVLERHGLTDEHLVRSAMQALAVEGDLGWTGATRTQLDLALRVVRGHLARLDVPPKLATVRDEALVLADDVRSHLPSGTPGVRHAFPEYDNVGRVVAAVELLDKLSPTAAATPPRSGAGRVVAW